MHWVKGASYEKRLSTELYTCQLWENWGEVWYDDLYLKDTTKAGTRSAAGSNLKTDVQNVRTYTRASFGGTISGGSHPKPQAVGGPGGTRFDFKEEKRHDVRPRGRLPQGR